MREHDSKGEVGFETGELDIVGACGVSEESRGGAGGDALRPPVGVGIESQKIVGLLESEV